MLELAGVLIGCLVVLLLMARADHRQKDERQRAAVKERDEVIRKLRGELKELTMFPHSMRSSDIRLSIKMGVQFEEDLMFGQSSIHITENEMKGLGKIMNDAATKNSENK